MLPIQAGVLLASIMIAVIRVVLAHSGGEGAASQELTKIIVRTIFASALFGVAITAGTTIADSVRLRSEEHTSELQSLMRTSYAVCYLNNQTIRLINFTT